VTEALGALILERTKLRLGVNKLGELSRLVYEISRRENIPFGGVLGSEEIESILTAGSTGYLAKFAGLKKYLLERRYPNASGERGFSAYLSRMKTPKRPVRTYSGKFRPERIFIERAAESYPLAKKVRELFGGVECKTIESLKSYRGKTTATPLDPRKRDLFVAVEQWDFVKPCPCTKNVVNCGYNVINLGFGCPYDCSYCYLQQYSNFPGLVTIANIEDYFPALEAYLSKRRGKKIRIGTGEFTDSLALDHITGHAGKLVSFFAGRNAVLELKTKSSNIENLSGLEHGGNTVVSWSLNPQGLVESEESGSASLQERLSAAKKCLEAGYGIGFHFDPVIYYGGWEKDYERVVNDLFDAVPEPAFISLGALRFHRTLKDVIEQRFPASGYIYGELVPGADRKMRYYASLRREIFRNMSAWIGKRNAGTEVYLCMEDAGMWRETLGRTSPNFFKEEDS